MLLIVIINPVTDKIETTGHLGQQFCRALFVLTRLFNPYWQARLEGLKENSCRVFSGFSVLRSCTPTSVWVLDIFIVICYEI